jgi:hypothetical protein
MVMKMRAQLMLLFVLAVMLSTTANSFAAIYKYIDENGIICFADDLQSIPEQCRATAKIVSGEQEEEKKSAIQKQPQSQAEAKTGNAASAIDRGKAPIEGHAKHLFSSGALISVVVVVSSLFAFVILGILDADHKKSIKIVRVVILWGASVYLIVAHAGDVVGMFRSVDSKIETVKRESGEKGKKAAATMKEINALIQNVDNAASQASGGSDPQKKD